MGRGRKALVPVAALLACTLAAGRPAPAARAQECPTTPAVDTVEYFGTGGGQPWSRVDAYFQAAGVDFDSGIMDNDTTRLCVGLEASCAVKKLWIQSEHRTNCLRPADFDGQLRIVGRIRGNSPRLLPAYGFGPDNADSTVYLLVRSGTVYALYRRGDVTAFAPQPVRSAPGWRFAYDTSAHSHAGGVPAAGPAALWRDTTVSLAIQSRAMGTRLAGGPAAWGDDELAAMQLTTLQYGWMACASGCCQFQGTGDGPTPGPDVHHHQPPPPPPGPPGPPPGPPPAPPRR